MCLVSYVLLQRHFSGYKLLIASQTSAKGRRPRPSKIVSYFYDQIDLPARQDMWLVYHNVSRGCHLRSHGSPPKRINGMQGVHNRLGIYTRKRRWSQLNN